MANMKNDVDDNLRFGNYLRFLREQREPKMTQEMLGALTGKNKMTISQIEKGKNSPPQGKFLDDIIIALKLTGEEETQLCDYAAIARNTIPADIIEYFNAHPGVRGAIRRAQKSNLPDSAWNSVFIGELNTNADNAVTHSAPQVTPVSTSPVQILRNPLDKTRQWLINIELDKGVSLDEATKHVDELMARRSNTEVVVSGVIE